MRSKVGNDKGRSGIPVLTYHGLAAFEESARNNNRFWVSEKTFAGHLEQIRMRELQPRTLSEIRQQESTSEKEVVITFDDGRASDYEVAFGVLTGARYKAEFFVNTATIGENGFLTWQQVKEMQEAGMSIQSHGHEHVDHCRLPLPELRRQLLVSKCEIEERTGRPVSFFAAPFGEWNRAMVEMAGDVGYEAICTTQGQLADCQTRVVDRIGIDGMTTMQDIDAILRRDTRFFGARALEFRLKRVPKKVVMQLFPAAMKAWRDRRHE